MTYITINNTVINTETGEVIGTVEQFESAIAFLSQDVEAVVEKAVEEACSEFEEPITTTSVTSPAKKTGQGSNGGPKPKATVNPFAHKLHEVEVSGWLDDVLTGAARLSTGNTVNNKWDLWRVVKNVKTITTTSVTSFFAKLQKPVGERQARTIAAQVRSLINSMESHMSKGNTFIYRDDFDFAEDAAGYLAIREEHINWVSPITDEQRQTILNAYKTEPVTASEHTYSFVGVYF